jgi:hypothetical protein
MVFYIVLMIFIGILFSLLFNKLLEINLIENKGSKLLFSNFPIIFICLHSIIIFISSVPIVFIYIDFFIIKNQMQKVMLYIYLFYVLLLMIPLNISMKSLTIKLYRKEI